MPEPTRTRGASGETLSVNYAISGLAAALDFLEDECEALAADPEAWEFLRAELTRDPKRGRRIKVRLTLISRAAVYRLRKTRGKQD